MRKLASMTFLALALQGCGTVSNLMYHPTYFGGIKADTDNMSINKILPGTTFLISSFFFFDLFLSGPMDLITVPYVWISND